MDRRSRPRVAAGACGPAAGRGAGAWRRTGAAVACVLLALAGAPGAAAQSLPLEAPAGAHPLLQDFVAICSRSMVNMAAALTEARGRGFDGLQGPGATLAMAMAGTASMERREGELEALLTMHRAHYPHATSHGCQIILMTERPAGLDVRELSAIEGLEGSAGPPSAPLVLGRWSLVDDTDAVVTVTVSEAGRNFLLAMGRFERIARD